MTHRIRAVSIAALSVGLLGFAGCAAEPEPAPTSPAPSTSTPQAAPTPPVEPDREDPTQLAVVRLNPDGRDAYSDGIAGPAVMVAGQAVRIDGWCAGGSVTFSLRAAATDQEQRELMGGRFVCSDAVVSNRYDGVDYSGVVQLVITEADDVETGWVQVLQPTPAG